jgi:hypothetical protein
VSDACRRELGGTGNLIVAPSIIGDAHCANDEDGGRPFAVGQVDPTKGFIHVLDDTSLDILLSTLDTITDLVEYLTKKERFVSSGRLVMAAGEDDLLAYHLRHLDEKGVHDFFVPAGTDGVFIDEGHWEEFSNSRQRKSQIDANKASYAWDALIEQFNKHIFNNTQYYTNAPGINNQEKYMRFLAREPRTRRRMLIDAFFGLIANTGDDPRGARILLPSKSGDPYYIFLLVRPYEGVAEEEYRELRGKLLEAYCMVLRLNFPRAQNIIGIASETGINKYRSDDIMYYDARDWTPEEQMKAENLQNELSLLQETNEFHYTEYEFPLEQRRHMLSSTASDAKYGRHWPCTCGSGKKFKRCCGRGCKRRKV